MREEIPPDTHCQTTSAITEANRGWRSGGFLEYPAHQGITTIKSVSLPVSELKP
jgi:hypothetical protein